MEIFKCGECGEYEQPCILVDTSETGNAPISCPFDLSDTPKWVRQEDEKDYIVIKK